ncbi:C-type lectin domain family 14 member A isoform X2 [Micropterus dolomieu]|nr:C-type lectin domain family 14 member A isoform X2 [Micropterus dolomieu]
MASQFCWIHLWILIQLFRNISADPGSPRYTVHFNQVNYDQAMQACSPGVLTTLATEQEVAHVLGLIAKSVAPLKQSNFTLWVGLRKVKDECVVTELPLRGFKWTDGSEESEVSRWTKEPEETCTSVLCAALNGDIDGSTVTRWSLSPVTCRKGYGFICKLRTGGTPEPAIKPATPEPATPGPQPASKGPATPGPQPASKGPATPGPQPASKGPATPGLQPATKGPATPGPQPASPEPATPDTDLKSTTGPKLQRPDPDPKAVPGLDPCQPPVIPRARSLIPDPNDSRRIQVQCWFPFQLDLSCSGRPAVWRLLDGSPANFSAICQPCEAGFQKDPSGDCEDVDECRGGARCRHGCLNTEGSYRCVCSNQSGEHHDEDSCADMAPNGDSGLMTGILIPALVAVAALVLLVVVVVVTVKCCLMRRSKKRAMKKAEKMAMRSKDSFETANEKVAT